MKGYFKKASHQSSLWQRTKSEAARARAESGVGQKYDHLLIIAFCAGFAIPVFLLLLKKIIPIFKFDLMWPSIAIALVIQYIFRAKPITRYPIAAFEMPLTSTFFAAGLLLGLFFS